MARRLRALNWIAAVAFTIGGSLFAAGAAVAQLGSGADLTPAYIYFAGGVFFNTGGYTALLQAINSPRGLAGDGSPVYERWRWWSYEPERIEWVSALTLFAGTIGRWWTTSAGPTTRGGAKALWTIFIIILPASACSPT